MGDNFKRGTNTKKSVTCELNSPESWADNSVTLKVTKIKPAGSKEIITCTNTKSEANVGFDSKTCQGSGTNWRVSAETDSIKVTIFHSLKETAVFRCDVSIDDDQASDSKLVTSEALGKKLVVYLIVIDLLIR